MLDLLDQLKTHQSDLEEKIDRIDKMQANRDRFMAAHGAILSDLAAPPDTAWDDLTARLRLAQQAARDHARLTAEVATEDAAAARDQRHRDAIRQQITAIAETLGWPGGDRPLTAHLAQCREATDLRAEIATLRRDLSDRPTPDMDDTDDAVQQRITALESDRQILREASGTCDAAFHEARRRLDAVGGDDALARIAEDRANLLLDTEDRARRHLTTRFGLMAFEMALHRYRDRHRSTMLSRASDAFERLSCGAYTGLSAQADGTRDVLMAQHRSGLTRMAADMSKGTRFQLYLALRIAGYHELALSRPAVPFIADDIMETFDDNRAAAAFSLLAEMSGVGQVIYLTHHRHLCDLARNVVPGVQIIDLQGLRGKVTMWT